MNTGEILSIDKLEDLRELTASDVDCQLMGEAEFRHIFTLCGALWQHSGDPEMPHALLTSGLHSDGFVDVLRVFSYPNLCELFARQFVLKLNAAGGLDDEIPDWVIGSDHAAATFSWCVARILGTRHDFTEKVVEPDGKKQQVWKRFEIQPDEKVLQVEELVTTTNTLKQVRQGIRDGNPHPVKFVPYVGTFIHRSSEFTLDGSPIFWFMHLDINSWEPDECPLCEQGSEAIRPKKNWSRLTGTG